MLRTPDKALQIALALALLGSPACSVSKPATPTPVTRPNPIATPTERPSRSVPEFYPEMAQARPSEQGVFTTNTGDQIEYTNFTSAWHFNVAAAQNMYGYFDAIARSNTTYKFYYKGADQTVPIDPQAHPFNHHLFMAPNDAPRPIGIPRQEHTTTKLNLTDRTHASYLYPDQIDLNNPQLDDIVRANNSVNFSACATMMTGRITDPQLLESVGKMICGNIASITTFRQFPNRLTFEDYARFSERQAVIFPDGSANRFSPITKELFDQLPSLPLVLTLKQRTG